MNTSRHLLPDITRRTRSSGFTLVEVLVAVLILAIGLLGMAGLQVVGLRNNNDAYLRSQATFLAYDLADRMRANKAALDLGSYQEVLGNEIDPRIDCISASCTSSQMAQVDIYQWLTSLRDALPSGQGTVSRNGAIHVIAITWDDNRDGSVDGSDPSFRLSVQP
jgi:type IV pilus assembly protein PilV